MMSVGVFILMGLFAPPQSLKSAQDCYDALDYVCAEQQLAIALRAQLDPQSLLSARKLDVLIAFAWRDDKRIDAGAKRLFELDPGLLLTGFPPDLTDRVERHRPEPPAASSLSISLDYRLQSPAPSSRDGNVWMTGEGGRIELGYLKNQDTLLTAYFEGLKHFPALDFSYASLTVYEFGFTWRPHYHFDRLHLHWGVGIGTSIQNLEVKDAYEPLLNAPTVRSGASISLLSGLCIRAVEQFFTCLSVDPKVLVRVESGQPQTSYLFPLGIGLRYEYRLKDKVRPQ